MTKPPQLEAVRNRRYQERAGHAPKPHPPAPIRKQLLSIQGAMPSGFAVRATIPEFYCACVDSGIADRAALLWTGYAESV